MKTIFGLTILLLSTNLHGQINTIKVRHADSSLCAYKFIADLRLTDKIFRLSKFTFSSPDKLTKKTANNIRSRLRLISEKSVYVNKFYFDSLASNICLVNKFKLIEIEIKQVSDSSHVRIDFRFIKNNK